MYLAKHCVPLWGQAPMNNCKKSKEQYFSVLSQTLGCPAMIFLLFLFFFPLNVLEASPCGNQTIRWSQLIKLKTQELHVQRLLFETLKDLSTCTTGVHVLYLNSHWVHSTEEKKRRQWPMCTFFRFWKVSIIFATKINEY